MTPAIVLASVAAILYVALRVYRWSVAFGDDLATLVEQVEGVLNMQIRVADDVGEVIGQMTVVVPDDLDTSHPVQVSNPNEIESKAGSGVRVH